MFHFGRFPSCTYVFSTEFMILHHEGFPIRKSAGRSLFAAHRSYRSLSRPSSAPDAKAFPLCSSSLELLCTSSDILCVLVCLNCCVSRFTVTFFASKIVFFVYPILRKDLLFSLSFLYTCSCTFSLYSVFNEHLCESLRFACSP